MGKNPLQFRYPLSEKNLQHIDIPEIRGDPNQSISVEKKLELEGKNHLNNLQFFLNSYIEPLSLQTISWYFFFNYKVLKNLKGIPFREESYNTPPWNRGLQVLSRGSLLV